MIVCASLYKFLVDLDDTFIHFSGVGVGGEVSHQWENLKIVHWFR